MSWIGRHHRVISGVVVLAAAFAALALTVGRGGLEVHGPVVSHERSWWSGFTPSSSMDANVSGVLELRGGCLSLSGRAVIWPSGTRWDDDEQILRSRGGFEAKLGDHISGGGGEMGPLVWEDEDAAKVLSKCVEVGGTGSTFNRDELLTIGTGE